MYVYIYILLKREKKRERECAVSDEGVEQLTKWKTEHNKKKHDVIFFAFLLIELFFFRLFGKTSTQINFVSIEISLQLFFLFCQNKNIMIEGILVLVYSMHRVSMKRKENSETYKGKKIFFFHSCGCDRKRKKREYIAFTAKEKKTSNCQNKSTLLLKSSGRPAEFYM
jgi:hypothetical protein